ncbi:glycosyltransferase family 1 protein [Acidothermaceae bacterium B102]|nr:glycosyltransferase family 1 protein [Acidothermaceae bacterium B102]
MSGADGHGPLALLDVHHLGLQQTGNESWARNAVAALEADQLRPAHYAVTTHAHLPLSVTPDRRHTVSTSSARRLALDMPRLLRAVRPDVVVAQYTLPPGRTPGVVVIHDLSFEDDHARQWIPLPTLLRYRWSIRSSARRARCVIVATQWTRQDMTTRYGIDTGRIVVCPISVEPGLARSLDTVWQTRAVSPPDIEAPVVLCVGTVLPRKNLVVVAKAVAQLRLRGVPATLRIVGKTPPAGEADAAAMSEVLGSAVSFAGHVDEAALIEEYQRATVLCFPSRYEGFGVPLLEAMTAGVPVVSSDATCLPEVGGDAALYADPDDVEAWADAVGSIIADAPLRESLVARGALRTQAYPISAVGPALRTAIGIAGGA